MAETSHSGGPYANSKAVMKLQIGEDGGPTRRIGVARLLSPDDPTTLSYDALVDLAIQYSFPNRAANRPAKALRKNLNVTTTYVDVDGDIITISSDAELCEAFDQFLEKKPPVLRVKAIAKKNGLVATPAGGWGKPAVASGAEWGSSPDTGPENDKKKTAEERREERRRKRAEARLLARTPATSSTAPASAAPPTPSRSSSTASASSQGSAASTTSRASQQGSPSRQLQTFLETFVSLLSAAVVALQTHLASNGAAPDLVSAFDNIGGRSTEVNSGRTAAKDENSANAADAASDQSKEKAKEKEEAKEVAERLMREVVGNISLQRASASETAPAATKPEEDKETEAEADAKGSEKTAEKPAEKEPSETWPENVKVPDGRDRNFIHGRHTCDGCLVTPIVGLRFHATNLPDYDLCQGCVGNYKGKEIKFEAEELARDRPYQHRWARRQAARMSRTGGAGCRRGFGGPAGRYPGACRGGPGGRRHHCHPTQQPQDVDMALKEAIRRSLLEANCGAAKEEPKKEEEKAAVPEKKAEEKPAVVEKRAEEKQEGKQAQEKQENAEKEVEEQAGEEEAKAEERVLPASAPVIEETSKPQPKEDSKPPAAPAPAPQVPSSPAASASSRTSSGTHESFASAADGNGDIAKAIGVTLDHCAEAIDAVLSEFEKGAANPAQDDDLSDTESKASKASRKSARSQKIGAAVASAVSSAVETAGIAAGVANEIAAAFDKQQQQQHKDAAVDVEEVSAMTSSVESAAMAEPEAPVLAATPPVAEGYAEILQPQDRPIPLYDDDEEEEEEHEVTSEEPKAGVESLAADGATILESLASPTPATMDTEANSDDHDETSKGESEEGWSVVDENEQIEADELLARAAQLVGSAIFQSDMSKSAEAQPAEAQPAESDASSASSSPSSRSATQSTSSGNTASSASLVSSASSVTSVPSTVPSLMTTEPISAPVLARWAPQLEQLRELGFEDERKSVDVLERLHAANIGVGETDEVTVTDVVNFLLNNAE